MKILLLLPVAAIALFSSSCRTTCPVDPETMRPDCTRCRIPADPNDCRHPRFTQVEETTTTSSK